MKDEVDLAEKIQRLLIQFDPEEFCEENSGDRAKRLAEYIAKNIPE